MKPKKYKCKDCDKSFAAWKSLTMHQHIHRGLTKCTICDIVSQNKWARCKVCRLLITASNLWRHVRTQHSRLEPKRCEHCNKQFKNKMEKIELVSEKMLHKCPECRRTFCSMNAMKRHRQAKHFAMQDSYVCAMCDARFKTKWSLSTHKSKYHRGQSTAGGAIETGDGGSATAAAKTPAAAQQQRSPVAAQKRQAARPSMPRIKTRPPSTEDA
uniref:C2H2-type domain-containing protein n=1 Tax=Anopheles stephensi TaxID=30069 RepID=A0A182YH22_ANOST